MQIYNPGELLAAFVPNLGAYKASKAALNARELIMMLSHAVH